MFLSNSTVNTHGGSRVSPHPLLTRSLVQLSPSYSARCPLLQLPSQCYKFWQRRGSESEVVGCWSLPTLMGPMVAIETTGWAPTSHCISSWYLGMWPMYLYRAISMLYYMGRGRGVSSPGLGVLSHQSTPDLLTTEGHYLDESDIAG